MKLPRTLPLLLSLFLAACSLANPQPPTVDPATPAAETAAAQASLAAQATPTETVVPTPGLQMESAEFQGVGFSYSQAVVSGLEAGAYPAELWAPLRFHDSDLQPAALAGVPDSILFSLAPAQAETAEAFLAVHPIRDPSGNFYPSISANAPAVTEALDDLSAGLASGGVPAEFFVGSDQLLQARMHKIAFQNGSGFAALTHYDGGRTAEITNDGLAYIFEGLTGDGRYYVAFRFPVAAAEPPDAIQAGQEAQDAWQTDPASYQSYLDEVSNVLAAIPPTEYRPNLNMLDALLASLRVQPQLEEPATVTPQPECSEAGRFVSETLADDSLIAPGQSFTKTWTIENAGTCTWTPEYRLVFVDGEQMGYDNTSPVYLEREVAPGQTVELTVHLAAPQEQGRYEANFKLENLEGLRFGVGPAADTAIWVRIAVARLGTELNLGAPDYLDTFDTDRSDWFIGGNEMIYSIEDGRLKITAVEPQGDRWRTADRPPLGSFYIEMSVITGDTCAGKDSYGFLLRAPEAEDNVVDSGYVFGFSCDGMVRFYRMDNGEFSLIQNWTPVEALKPGPNQTNRVGVRARQGQFQVYVNGVLAGEYVDDKYLLGLFGIMLRADSPDGFTIYVDEIAYWEAP